MNTSTEVCMHEYLYACALSNTLLSKPRHELDREKPLMVDTEQTPPDLGDVLGQMFVLSNDSRPCELV